MIHCEDFFCKLKKPHYDQICWPVSTYKTSQKKSKENRVSFYLLPTMHKICEKNIQSRFTSSQLNRIRGNCLCSSVISIGTKSLMDVGFHVSHASLEIIYAIVKLLFVSPKGGLVIQDACLVVKDIDKKANQVCMVLILCWGQPISQMLKEADLGIYGSKSSWQNDSPT